MPRKKELSYETEKYPFPSRLRKLMEANKTTQRELAQAIGMRPQTVSLYVLGQSFPDVNGITKIARFFSVSSDYLLGLSPTPSVDEDIQVACKVTGFSEKAINAIKRMGTMDIDILNSILEYNLFSWILTDIHRLAQEESTRSYAKKDEKKAMSNRNVQDYLEKMAVVGEAEESKDVLEYRVLKKFKKMLDTVVGNLALRKDFQVYGEKMAEAGYWNEAKFYSELQKELDAEKEGENNGEH